MRGRIFFFVVGGVLAGGLAACANGATALRIPASDLATPSPLAAAAPLPSPFPTSAGNLQLLPQATPDQATVRVWWPDELYPQASRAAEDILAEQFNGFRATYASYGLEVRRKRANGLGGILPTLRSANPVAPGALPDLTLMRRPDLLAAVAEGLIVPLDDWVPPDILDNLVPSTRALGDVNGVLYGIPYALNITHIAYRSSVFDAPLLTFEAVLDRQPVYLFPARSAPGVLVSETVLIQYLAAGGTLVDAAGNPALDREPLLAVLAYYAQGAHAGLFGSALLTYSDYNGYWNNFASGAANMIGVDSVTYLSHPSGIQNIGLAPIPTQDGTPLTALDGWMWVLTTQDPDHQKQARAFLSWMMRVNQQGIYTEALGVLPSQQRALRLWDDSTYADFAQDLLIQAQVIPVEQQNNSAAAALQDGLSAVLQGTSAEVAVDEALGKLAE